MDIRNDQWHFLKAKWSLPLCVRLLRGMKYEYGQKKELCMKKVNTYISLHGTYTASMSDKGQWIHQKYFYFYWWFNSWKISEYFCVLTKIILDNISLPWLVHSAGPLFNESLWTSINPNWFATSCEQWKTEQYSFPLPSLDVSTISCHLATTIHRNYISPHQREQ